MNKKIIARRTLLCLIVGALLVCPFLIRRLRHIDTRALSSDVYDAVDINESVVNSDLELGEIKNAFAIFFRERTRLLTLSEIQCSIIVESEVDADGRPSANKASHKGILHLKVDHVNGYTLSFADVNDREVFTVESTGFGKPKVMGQMLEGIEPGMLLTLIALPLEILKGLPNTKLFEALAFWKVTKNEFSTSIPNSYAFVSNGKRTGDGIEMVELYFSSGLFQSVSFKANDNRPAARLVWENYDENHGFAFPKSIKFLTSINDVEVLQLGVSISDMKVTSVVS
jgi:hypothetical protein